MCCARKLESGFEPETQVSRSQVGYARAYTVTDQVKGRARSSRWIFSPWYAVTSTGSYLY